MEGLGWTLFFIVITPIVLLLLFTWWLEAGYRRENPGRVGSKQSVRARQEAARIQPRAAELPAPGYLRRWNAGRRQDAGHEHKQWQEAFDRRP